MKYMVGSLQWFQKDNESGEPDISDEVAIEVTAVRTDGSIQIGYPDGNGKTYIDFSLRDLMEQVCLVAGNAE